MGHAVFVVLAVAFPIVLPTHAEDSVKDNEPSEVVVGTLAYVDTVSQDDWQGVCSIALSPDGRHAYAEAFNTAAVFAFDRDASTGRLSLIQTISSREDFNGVTSLRLSPDGQYAVSAAFRSDKVVLFKRDPDSGKLEVLDEVRRTTPPGLAFFFEEDGQAGDEEPQPFHRSEKDDCAVIPYGDFRFVIEAIFAPDSRVIHALCCSSETVVTFRVTEEEKLDLVEVIRSVDHCFANARGVVVTSDGRSMYMTSQRGNTLTVLDRDPGTGKATIVQVCKDEEEGFHALQGAFSVTCSPDERYVYVSSGQFGGDDAVSVYRRNEDGTVTLVQELFNGTDNLEGFEGGNEILVSPDGCNVYALGSISDTIVSFRRDPETGKIEQIQLLRDQTDGVGSLKDASGLAISSDGQFLYVAGDNAVSIFRRNVPQAVPAAE